MGTTVGAWVRQRKKVKYDMVVTKASADPVECSGLGLTFQSCHNLRKWAYSICPMWPIPKEGPYT